MATMIVTNGSRLRPSFLEKNKQYLDWIAISIDSLNDDTNLQSGRALSGKKVISREGYLAKINNIKKYGYVKTPNVGSRIAL